MKARSLTPTLVLLSLLLLMLGLLPGALLRPPPLLGAGGHSAATGEQLPLSLTQVGQIGGRTVAVATQGNYAYLGVGVRLIIMNMTDPMHPVSVGRSDVLPDSILSLTVANGYVYAALGVSGLQIIDVSDPSKPRIVGTLAASGFVSNVAVQGNHAYVSDSWLRIADISDPANPIIIGNYKTISSPGAVAVADNYAYITFRDFDIGTTVLNIADPARPRVVSMIPRSDLTMDIALAGNYAYIIGEVELQIVNIANPTSPVEISVTNMPTASSGVVSGNHLYTIGEDQLSVISIANAAAPEVVTTIGTPSTFDIAVAGHFAYMAAGNDGLSIFDISTPSNTHIANDIVLGGSPTDVVVAGNYAFVAVADAGMRVIDAHNPAELSEVDAITPAGLLNNLAVAGNYAYLASGTAGLHIVDISQPTNISQVSTFYNYEDARDVAVREGYAYLVDGYSGLVVVDVSNPAIPEAVAYSDTSTDLSDSRRVAIDGQYAYVIDGDRHSITNTSLALVNIADPLNPTFTSAITVPEALDLAVSGNNVYVAGPFGLTIIDVTDPSAPIKIGTYATLGNAQGVSVVGTNAYISDGYGGVRIIDVTNSGSPVEIGRYNALWSAQNAAVVGNHVFVANGSDGLAILQVYDSNSAPPTPTPTTSPPTATPTQEPPNQMRRYIPLVAFEKIVLTPIPPTATIPPPAVNSCDDYEPNDDRRATNKPGPLVSGKVYQAKLCIGDAEDNFFFETTTNQAVVFTLTLPKTQVGFVDIWVYAQSDFSISQWNPLCGTGPVETTTYTSPPCQIPGPGRYIIRLYTYKNHHDSINPYTLNVIYT